MENIKFDIHKSNLAKLGLFISIKFRIFSKLDLHLQHISITMKKIVAILFILTATSSFGQTFIKGNAATAVLLIPNVGIETSIGKKMTFQFDVTASLWKSVKGIPSEFYMFVPEVRYYFKEKFNGFYVGGHMGSTFFNFQKWNYKNTDKYEEGLGYNLGATIGYQRKISNKLSLDFFLGGGWHQGFYKGYYIGTNDRYETAQNYNKSGEWLPYRGGVMLCYRLN